MPPMVPRLFTGAYPADDGVFKHPSEKMFYFSIT